MGGRGANQGITSKQFYEASSMSEAKNLGNKLSKGLSITEDQEKALERYTGSGYNTMNNFLRGKTATIHAKIGEQITNLSNFLKGNKVKQNLVVFRGGTMSAFPEKYRNDLTKLIGKTIQDNGFMSTSIHKASAFVHKPVMFKIKVPKGTEGAYVGKKSQHGEELEFLMNKGTKTKITNIFKNSKGQWEVEAEVVN